MPTLEEQLKELREANDVVKQLNDLPQAYDSANPVTPQDAILRLVKVCDALDTNLTGLLNTTLTLHFDNGTSKVIKVG